MRDDGRVIQIDGTMGEGGGQVLRTALALSMVSGRAFRILDIRGKRKVPGLLRQHLVAVQAAARVSSARVLGDSLGSTQLTFEPGPVVGTVLSLPIGSAGSATLVMQAVVPALLGATGPSRITIEGGTHNPLAPPFEFLSECWASTLSKLGANVSLRLERHGFYPRGGGRVVAEVQPSKLQPIELTSRGALLSLEITSALAESLPTHIIDRELTQAGTKLARYSPKLVRAHVPADGMGNAMTLVARYEHVTHVSSALGEKGVPAEEVADDLVHDFERFHAVDVPVGEHLADMLPIALSLAGGGRFTTSPLSVHATTQIDLLPMFLPVSLTHTRDSDGRTTVAVARKR